MCTSQQQIQRFETGTPVKLARAAAIAKALKTSIQKVFPEVKKVDAWKDPRKDEERLLKAGVEVDPRHWVACFQLRGEDPGELATAIQSAWRTSRGWKRFSASNNKTIP